MVLQAGISQDNLRRWDIISTEKIIASINSKLSDETRNQYATYIVDEVNENIVNETTYLIPIKPTHWRELWASSCVCIMPKHNANKE